MRRLFNKYKIYIIVALGLAGWYGYDYFQPEPERPTYNQLNELLASSKELEKVSKVDVYFGESETTLKVIFKDTDVDPKSYAIPVTDSKAYLDKFSLHKIPVVTGHAPLSWYSILNILVTLLFIGTIYMSNKKMGLFGEDMEVKPKKSDVRFKDVQGIDDVRDQLQQIVAFLKDPDKLMGLGGRAPKGTLLVGSPGNGKTMLAKALAGEAGVPFFAIAGSEFDSMFVGSGASRVKKLFKVARENAPCLIFIDEIDSIGKKRREEDSKYSSQSLNQLLTEIDGFDGSNGVILVGATNRVEDLDEALRRPGRFDREIHVPMPDVKGRAAILTVTAEKRKIPMDASVNLVDVARGTPGFSGAATVNLLNEAVLFAASENRKTVTMDDFEHAREKLTMGMPRAQILNAEERRVCAYHEAGHALLGLKHSDVLDPIYKATILPRGNALGMVTMFPDKESVMTSRKKLMALLAMMYGGRLAEKLVLGDDDITTGASSDLQQITMLANRMVTEWGLGSTDKLAYRYAPDVANGTVGRLMELSDDTKESLARQVDELVTKVEKEAMETMTRHKDVLEDITQELLDKETISGEDLRKAYLSRLRDEVTKAVPLAISA